MRSKSLLAFWLTLLLVGLLALAFEVQLVQAGGTIYIRADGSVDPPTAPISSVDYVTYALTGNINGSIVVERDNIAVDGAGCTVEGTGSGRGIDLSGRSNITVKNVNVVAFKFGIYLEGSSGNMLVENNIIENVYSIYLEASSNNTITMNNATNNNVGIRLRESSNNTILWNSITKQEHYSIGLSYSSGNIIAGNNITENGGGINIFESSNCNTIYGNNVTAAGEGCGVGMGYSSNCNSVYGNNIANHRYSGVAIGSSLNNSVYGNNIVNNREGVSIGANSKPHSKYNSVYGNNIVNNEYGFFMYDSSNNSIHRNNFINNTQVFITNLINSWDDGVEGNYWSNYTGVDLNLDGIGDSAHVINENNIDQCPLMGTFHSFNTSRGYMVNVISNSTIQDFKYYESNRTIKMHVSNSSLGQTFGFCRIRIPHALMNEPYNVTVDGAEPHYINYTLLDDGDNRWVYFTYQHSTREITITQEFPPFLLYIIIPLGIMTTILLIVMIYIKEHQTARVEETV